MDQQPQAIIKQALDNHERITISFSGAEDVVLIDMACRLSDEIKVFSLDTGRLHPETVEFIQRVQQHYGVNIDLVTPDAKALDLFVKAKGMFSFYEDGHQECCSVRKIEPLRRYLANWDAWITGQRKDQSPTRAEVKTQETDAAFSTPEHQIAKYNPLANWSSSQVWQYIKDNDVPYNELHDRSYLSIGCEPCTRAIKPHEHERAGRWWWEESTQKECGLHVPEASQSVELLKINPTS